MKNSRQDPPGSQEEIKRDVCERVYPARGDKVFARRLCDVWMWLDVCVCVCECSCLSACLDMEFKKYPGGRMPAIRFEIS